MNKQEKINKIKGILSGSIDPNGLGGQVFIDMGNGGFKCAANGRIVTEDKLQQSQGNTLIILPDNGRN